MIQRFTLFDLFGDFSARWPALQIRQTPGFNDPNSPPNPQAWLGALNNAVSLSGVRTGALGSRVAVEATLSLDPIAAGFPEGFPFVLEPMPDVELRIPAIQPPYGVRLFASVSSSGAAEVLLETLPVEIRLPVGLIAPHPDVATHPSGITEQEIGDFVAGEHDHLKLVLRNNEPTSIFVHMRVHINEELEVSMVPAVPVSFGSCTFSGQPCKALHDFTLLPFPSLAQETTDWIRHDVDAWIDVQRTSLNGCFAVRSVHFDTTAEGLVKDLVDKVSNKTDQIPEAELVIDDVVVPFFSMWFLPLPRHLTMGLRRRAIDPSDPQEIFAFEESPIYTRIKEDPEIHLYFDRLFWASQPFGDLLENPALDLAGGLVFGKDKSAQDGVLFEFGDNYTLRFGYRRDYGPNGLPELPQLPDPEGHKLIGNLLHSEIAGISIDLMTAKIGFSFGRYFNDDKGFLGSLEVVSDVFVFMPPTGDDDKSIRLRSLNGEKAAFLIEGVGYRFGSLSLDGLSLPDGMRLFVGPVVLTIEEIGLLAEHGASYLSLSGGLAIDPPGDFSGGFHLERLRFRLLGDESAPPMKLDGAFGWLENRYVRLDVGGAYSEVQDGATKISEYAFTGTIVSKLPTETQLSVDVLSGTVSSPEDRFNYFMLQGLLRGSLVLCALELRSVRILMAANMLPDTNIADRSWPELKYLNWYRASDPLRVPGNRRLAAWRPQPQSNAAGIGLGVSFPGLGKVAELNSFVMAIWGEVPDELLFFLELYAMGSDKPVAYGALEWDLDADRLTGLLGVELTLDNFLENAPDWSKNIARLTGNLFFSNDPRTIALGRLADPRSWLRLVTDVDFFIGRTYLELGYCFEYTEAPGGSNGFGLLLRLEGGIDAKAVAITFNAGFGLSVAFFETGSSDFAVVAFLEAGIRAVVLKVVRFGLSAGAELRSVGRRPSRSELALTLRFETPWFLPDVTWRFECVSGQLAPEELEVAVTPLRLAWASHPIQRSTLPIHVERFDRGWDGTGVAATHSLSDLAQGGVSESARLAAFANNSEAAPVPTDSTIGLELAVRVRDRLALGAGVGAFGHQQSGDLDLSYELVGIRVRRRDRFGDPGDWQLLSERLAPGGDFTDIGGVQPDAVFAPEALSFFWDASVRSEGKTAAKKLLINASTPFEFELGNPRVDEEIVTDAPAWPCCSTEPETPPVHEILFRQDLPGQAVRPRFFSASHSLLRTYVPAFVRPTILGAAQWGSGTRVAYARVEEPRVLFRGDLDEAAAFCSLRLAFRVRGSAELRVIGFDRDEQVVGTKTFPLSGAPVVDLNLPATGRLRRFEVQILMPPPPENPEERTLVELEVDRFAYIGLADYLDTLVAAAACEAGSGEQGDVWAGRGKLFFLPNHDYEVELTTRVSIAHPATDETAEEVKEYAYFHTKGLPGLNAQSRVGEEVEPYVRGTYAGGRSLLYREEPVALQFKEDFHVAVPLEMRPESGPEAPPERSTFLEMALTARADSATDPATPHTTTSSDWIVAHRAEPGPIVIVGPWADQLEDTIIRAARTHSLDPARERLAGLTQRPGAVCGLEDPRDVVTPVLVAPPRGATDPDDPARQLWPAVGSLTATVRPAAEGFVDRRRFESADRTAFSFATDTTASGSADWTVEEGELVAAGPAGARRYARFGEDSWLHLRAEVGFRLEGEAAGLAFALPGGSGAPAQGLLALVEVNAGGHRLAVYRRQGGGGFQLLASAALPELPAGDLALSVTAFDDHLRLEALGVTLEAERGALRRGRLALVADGTVRFARLGVEGLDIYRFPVPMSRYAGFKEHVESFDGSVGIVRPDDLGPGTTLQSAAFRWAKTAKSVRAAMQEDAEPERRQALFADWVHALGLPLQTELEGFELSRIVDANGATTALLVESPEPIDFVHEASVQIAIVTTTGDPTSLAALEGPKKGGGSAIPGDTPIELEPLQGGDTHRVLLVPTVNGLHHTLEAGPYDLTFTLLRRRWETTDNADTLSRYLANGTLRVEL